MTLTAERKTEILGLWNDGLSATLVGQRFSISRSAVIGVVHRAKAKGEIVRSANPKRGTRPKVARRKPSAPLLAPTVSNKANGNGYHFHGGKVRKPVPAPAKVTPARPKRVGKPIPFLALRDSLCKFVVSGRGGHLDPFMFCGAPVRLGYSWCDHCCDIVFNRISQPNTLPRDRRQQVRAGSRNTPLQISAGGASA